MSFHPWWRWECFENGFYSQVASCPKQRSLDENKYMEFHLKNGIFYKTLLEVSFSWPFSFENFLCNKDINRIAWLGQVSICFKLNISSYNRGAYNRLDLNIRRRQNKIAEDFILRWENEYNSGNSGSVYLKLGEERIQQRDSRRSSSNLDERKLSSFIQSDMLSYFK